MAVSEIVTVVVGVAAWRKATTFTAGKTFACTAPFGIARLAVGIGMKVFTIKSKKKTITTRKKFCTMRIFSSPC